MRNSSDSEHVDLFGDLSAMTAGHDRNHSKLLNPLATRPRTLGVPARVTPPSQGACLHGDHKPHKPNGHQRPFHHRTLHHQHLETT